MKITDAKIKELAHLCRLEFENEQFEQIKVDLARIIEFCEKLNEVNTDGVEPLIYMSDHYNNIKLRDDEVLPSLPQNEALKNAPSADSDYFRVPKFIKK